MPGGRRGVLEGYGLTGIAYDSGYCTSSTDREFVTCDDHTDVAGLVAYCFF